MVKIEDIKQVACGRWQDVFSSCGIEFRHNKKHGPCPICGGKDRFRVDDKNGDGTWYCNHCGAGDGLKLVTLWMNNDIKQAIGYCANYFGMQAESDFDIDTAKARSKNARAKQIADDHKTKEINHQLAVNTASELLEYCDVASSEHPYLVRKIIKRCTSLECIDQAIIPTKSGKGFNAIGSLVIPMIDDNRKLVNCQVITPSGFKMFLMGGKIIGAFHIIGRMVDGQPIMIVEGFATGATVYESLGYCTVVAFNANNLLAVAESIRYMCHESFIVVCGDNDWRLNDNNVGKKKAVNVQMKVSRSRSIYAPFARGVTDFNDLDVIHGERISKFFIDKLIGVK